MIKIRHNYNRYENESDEELIYRITNDKEQIGTWDDVAEILNELLGTNYTESKFRKQKQYFDKMLTANQKHFVDTKTQIAEIEMKRRELEREKIKFRDERNAWNKQNYITARVEQKLDHMEDVFSQISKCEFPNIDQKVQKDASENDMLVVLSDLHIGQSFNSTFGEYNSDIAKTRLQYYLNQIIAIQHIHKAENCVVSLQGDLISGNIHKTIAISNRENVIEQVKCASELIASFCYELAKHFTQITLINVSGNHSRIDRKDESLHDERLDDLIIWIVRHMLANLKNIEILQHYTDIGIAEFLIRGKRYVSVHGDFDSFNKSGIFQLSSFLGYIPYAIVFGHIHRCAFDEINEIKMISGGSLSGSGDDYTIEKRLKGKPSQMICVCNHMGILCYYPIVFPK